MVVLQERCALHILPAAPGPALPPPPIALAALCASRQAALPWWHFEMVADQARNAAYGGAIARAVRRLVARGGGDPLVLDAGAGSGLLSLMAAR